MRVKSILVVQLLFNIGVSGNKVNENTLTSVQSPSSLSHELHGFAEIQAPLPIFGAGTNTDLNESTWLSVSHGNNFNGEERDETGVENLIKDNNEAKSILATPSVDGMSMGRKDTQEASISYDVALSKETKVHDNQNKVLTNTKRLENQDDPQDASSSHGGNISIASTNLSFGWGRRPIYWGFAPPPLPPPPPSLPLPPPPPGYHIPMPFGYYPPYATNYPRGYPSYGKVFGIPMVNYPYPRYGGYFGPGYYGQIPRPVPSTPGWAPIHVPPGIQIYPGYGGSSVISVTPGFPAYTAVPILTLPPAMMPTIPPTYTTLPRVNVPAPSYVAGTPGDLYGRRGGRGSGVISPLPGINGGDGSNLNGRFDWNRCAHSAQSRQCWYGRYNINTDIRREFPTSGRVRTYYLEAEEKTLAPDGVPRRMLVFNGQYPGPLIEANWGDTVRVVITNRLRRDGISVHWHGIHQAGTNEMDGVNGVTECPITPGGRRVYQFQARQYGTGWYHSHYSSQYGEGLLGMIIIHGPSTANYDIDLGVLPITDWFHTPLTDVSRNGKGNMLQDFTADNVLINGTTGAFDGTGRGMSVTKLQAGKKHLLRLINTGINQYFHVSLDGHPFTVVGADFVPVKPFKTNELVIGVGQRYDVIIGGEGQAVGSYWLRVGIGSSGGVECDGKNRRGSDVRAIFRYEGAPVDEVPRSQGIKLSSGCYDQPGLQPWFNIAVPRRMPRVLMESFKLTSVQGNAVQWTIDNSALRIDWRRPTLEGVVRGNFSFPREYNIYNLGEGEDWTYWVIQSDRQTPESPHPIHLHGHDFMVIGQGVGSFTAQSSMNFANPMRRDTANIPGHGYLVLAFQMDNPGAWLMHCHIPFHVATGFGLQFIERAREVSQRVRNFSENEKGCYTWRRYQDGVRLLQTDSGL